MAKRRPASRRRRRRKRMSRLPAILFAAMVATVAGYLFVKASGDGEAGSDPVPSVETSDPDSAGSTDPAGESESSSSADPDSASSATDPSNLGKPVQIFSDALGDLDIDQVIDDWTPVDRPVIPQTTAPIESDWVKSGRITSNLPDGYYWGVPVSTFDEDERGINFDIRQAFWGDACIERFGLGDDTCLNDYQVLDTGGTQLYPSYLGDLLFVSFAVYGDTDSESNVAVVPATFWSLFSAGGDSGSDAVMVTVPSEDPDPPSVPVSNSPFLLTIVDGVIIAAEGIWVP